MITFNLTTEQRFDPKKHVEMRTPTDTVEVAPGAICVNPPGEVHEYVNGQQCSLLFRVRYGASEPRPSHVGGMIGNKT